LPTFCFALRGAAWMRATPKPSASSGAFDGVPRDERAVINYLVGELWRRIGDAALAEAWFDRVRTEVVDGEAQQWIVEAADQQRDCPREWFS
jgi:hypothetical protein